jgi:hypothetical protein
MSVAAFNIKNIPIALLLLWQATPIPARVQFLML